MVKQEINHNGKKVFLQVSKLSKIGMIRGLMFRPSKTDSLLFSFKKNTKMSIHSFFVFFPFLAVWLDEHNRIIDFKIVKPFTSIISAKKEYRKLIEIPLNRDNKKLIDFLVG